MKSQMAISKKLILAFVVILALTVGLAYSSSRPAGTLSNKLMDEVNPGSQEQARSID